MAGYPEIVSGKTRDPIAYLKDVSSNYLYKDALEYDNVKKPDILVKLLQLLAFQIGNEVSYNELATRLKVDRDIRYTLYKFAGKSFCNFSPAAFCQEFKERNWQEK